jgi:hypothetical protein
VVHYGRRRSTCRHGRAGLDQVTSSSVYLGFIGTPLLGGRSKCEMKAEVAGLTGGDVASAMA